MENWAGPGNEANIWTLLSFDFCMCNTTYNLKAVFSSLAFLKFGRPFSVTACTHSNMSLKSEGASATPPLLAYTLGSPQQLR